MLLKKLKAMLITLQQLYRRFNSISEHTPRFPPDEKRKSSPKQFLFRAAIERQNLLCGKASVVVHIAGESDRVDWIGREKGFRSRNQATIPESAFLKGVENRSTFFSRIFPLMCEGEKMGRMLQNWRWRRKKRRRGRNYRVFRSPPFASSSSSCLVAAFLGHH